jgi:hypoxanthine phosphoribosyltransferase
VADTVGNRRDGVVQQDQPPWANSTEQQFAALLDSYGISWEHEPHRFPVAFDDDGNPIEFFTPDFYLPDTDEYIELTVLKQSLCTRKNRKVRLLREIYPDVRCRIIYRHDYESLALKYDWGSDPDFPGLGIPRRRPGPPQICVPDV